MKPTKPIHYVITRALHQAGQENPEVEKAYIDAVKQFEQGQWGLLEPEDIQEFCRGKIARYKIPKYVFFIDQFPLTGSGKIQKFKLKEMSLELCKQQGIEVI